MSKESIPKRPAKRKQPEKTSDAKNKTVTVSEEAFLQVSQCARNLKMSKAKFASAAISFFAKSGLDPTEEMPQGLASIGRKVESGVDNVRAHNADIGNRLYALIRGFERTLYQFMQQQQLTTYSYLESIESNILRHLISVETNLLEQTLEHVLRTEKEAYVTRGLSQRILLELLKQPASWTAQNDKLNGERDEMLVAALREHLAKHKVPTPRPNAKPGATPVPTKPVASTAPPTTPKQ